MGWFDTIKDMCQTDKARSVFSGLTAGCVAIAAGAIVYTQFFNGPDQNDPIERAKYIQAENRDTDTTEPDEYFDESNLKTEESDQIAFIAILDFIRINNLEQGQIPSQKDLLQIYSLAQQLGDYQEIEDDHTRERRNMAAIQKGKRSEEPQLIDL